jgi:hypothetical protein
VITDIGFERFRTQTSNYLLGGALNASELCFSSEEIEVHGLAVFFFVRFTYSFKILIHIWVSLDLFSNYSLSILFSL